jgi:hypothetical protein
MGMFRLTDESEFSRFADGWELHQHLGGALI